MNGPGLDWEALERLRSRFLEGTAGQEDYWRSETDLASYDATFAQRIGWKWDYVLAELARRGWSPPPGAVLDWGCGSGIAHRAFLDHFEPGAGTALLLLDRSELAVAYARRRAQERFPHVTIRPLAENEPIGSLLLSHVLSELNEAQTEDLLSRLPQATAVLWVEPGTHAISRQLSRLRDRLLGRFQVIAPCTHHEVCGMLRPGNESHWCHHFASPPPAVFSDRYWARFASLAGIDLRSLPLSFLVMDQRPMRSLPTDAVRIIGSPRIYKGYALLFGCEAGGVRDRRLSKKNAPEMFRRLKKGQCDPVQLWVCEEDEINQVGPLPRV
ncbi:MAG: small ribosomal subunit Rsm22 family protein [Verrucomicrobiota bacterium]